MQLHDLRPAHKNKTIKRIGRGGKRGTFSGRGSKGQKSRAGAKMRPAARDLLIKIPKLRGYGNNPVSSRAVVLNIRDLETKFENQKIDKQACLQKKLIKKMSERVKILGEGEVKRTYDIEGIDVSKKAKEKILAAGGKINESHT